LALRLAAAQMASVDPPVRHPAPPILHQNVKDKAAHPGPKASGASVDPDAVHPDGADRSAQCLEAVRDSHRWASVDAPEQKVACLVLQQPDAPPMAA
jgi:hypothetical protein